MQSLQQAVSPTEGLTKMRWGQLLIAYLIGSFFGVMQILNLLRGVTGARQGG